MNQSKPCSVWHADVLSMLLSKGQKDIYRLTGVKENINYLQM